MIRNRYDDEFDEDYEEYGRYDKDDYYDDIYPDRQQPYRHTRRSVSSGGSNRSYDDDYGYSSSYTRRDSLRSRGRREAVRREESYERRDDTPPSFRGMYGQRSAPDAPRRHRSSGALSKIFAVLALIGIIIGSVVVVSTINSNLNPPKENASKTDAAAVTETDITSGTDEQENTADAKEEKAKRLLAQMSDEEKVGQLLLIRGDNMTESDFRNLITECKVGGVVLFKGDFEGKTKSDVRGYIERLQNAGNGRMLVCVDEEGGTVVRLSGFTALRSKKYKSPQDVYKAGGFDGVKSDTENKCEFLKGFGINVNFAPVADVVTSKKGFLYKRAFGKKAEETAKYVSTVVKAMDENGVGSTLKHFPGYGNSTGDTHKGLDHNTKRLENLKKSDLVPFKSGIESGADSIMVTHTIIDKVDKNNPASMSEKCISLIRDYLEFDGVVITDGLDMGAVTQFCGKKDPCVQCVLGGCDLLCTPSDAKKSYDNLLAAVKDGTISGERLDKSVMRILKWKIKLGLYD